MNSTTTSNTSSKQSGNRSNTETVDLQPLVDLQHYVQEYARQKPEMAALGCLLAGFVLGWKLKPW